MTEKWENAVDNGKVFGVLVTDLSKTFDCVCHDFFSFKSRRKQKTKNGIAYSLWEEIVSGVPQRSILDPLLFNIFVCDLFLSTESSYFINYTDDTTPCVIGNDNEVVSELKLLLKNYLFGLHKTK